MKKAKFMLMLMLMLLASFLHLFAQTREGMSLGNLQFVKPSNDITMSSRSLKMRMSTASISPRFYAKVGGVAFIQTAIPNFDVESLQLNCDYSDNNSYAVINGQRYNIPLEVWQLQPIVEYADDENNAAVTIFGDKDSRIKLHEAFIDKLIGLRLLQLDLLLATSYLDMTDRGKFPSYDGDEYIMSEKEKKEYHKYVLLDSILYNASYQDISMTASYHTYMQIDSLSEQYETYIYTDYNQDISFNVNPSDNSIDFSGKPYYRFAYRDTSVVDTLEMYNSIVNYIDSFEVRKKQHCKSLANYTFSKEQNELLYKLQSIVEGNKNIQDKAKMSFELLDFYSRTKDPQKIESDLISFGISTLLIDSYVDSLSLCSSETPKVLELCKELNSVIGDFRFSDCDNMLIYNLSKELLKEKSSDEKLQGYFDVLDKFKLTSEQSLIIYLYKNQIPGIVEAVKITDHFRNEGSLYIHFINPLIYDEATAICHWSTFFRYVKQNHPETWRQFKQDVRSLTYDAPYVWTPIDFGNSFDQ